MACTVTVRRPYVGRTYAVLAEPVSHRGRVQRRGEALKVVAVGARVAPEQLAARVAGAAEIVFGLGLAGGIGQMAIFYRPPTKTG